MIQDLVALPFGVLMVLALVALSEYVSNIFNALLRIRQVRKDRMSWEQEQRKNRGL